MRQAAIWALLLSVLSPAVAQRVAGPGSGNATALQGTPIAATPPASGNCLVYSASGLNWAPSSCSGTASTAWANLTSGTNTGAAMVVGSGASLSASGSGAIAATTAAALATTPNQCTGGEFATGVTATGNANCSTPAGGGASSGTGTLQVSNGTGGFLTSSFFKADTTNGYFGNLNGVANPTTPFDVEWTGIAGSASAFAVATFNCGLTSTASTPGDLHCFNDDVELSGASTFNGTGLTDTIEYAAMTDTRAPASASTVAHEMADFGEVNVDGGANLTCSTCAAGWFVANFGGTGETVTNLDDITLNGTISGTGTIDSAGGVNIGLPSAPSGPALDNVYGVETSDPNFVQHGTGGSGYAAGFSVGVPSGTGVYGYVESSTAANALNGGLVLGSTTTGSLGGTNAVVLDAEGGVDLGSDSGGTTPPVCIRSYSSGLPNTCISAISGGQTLKLPSDSVTLSGTAGNYNSSSAITGNLAAQTLFAFPDGNSRFFRLDVYGTCTTAVASSTVTISVGYTDQVQAQTQSSSAETCAAAGDILTYSTLLYANTANVTVSTTTANSPVYDLHARLALLGPNTINSQ